MEIPSVHYWHSSSDGDAAEDHPLCGHQPGDTRCYQVCTLGRIKPAAFINLHEISVMITGGGACLAVYCVSGDISVCMPVNQCRIPVLTNQQCREAKHY